MFRVGTWGESYRRANRHFPDRRFNLAILFHRNNSREVTRMNSMFQEAQNFNQNISGWDVGGVTNMGSMFYGAFSFNQDISDWDVGKVTNMKSMFYEAYSFNQDISTWDVGNVQNMRQLSYRTNSLCPQSNNGLIAYINDRFFESNRPSRIYKCQSMAPSMAPSMTPSMTSSMAPSMTPSMASSMTPSMAPSRRPTIRTSITPSAAPSIPLDTDSVTSKDQFASSEITTVGITVAVLGSILLFLACVLLKITFKKVSGKKKCPAHNSDPTFDPASDPASVPTSDPASNPASDPAYDPASDQWDEQSDIKLSIRSSMELSNAPNEQPDTQIMDQEHCDRKFAEEIRDRENNRSRLIAANENDTGTSRDIWAIFQKNYDRIFSSHLQFEQKNFNPDKTEEDDVENGMEDRSPSNENDENDQMSQTTDEVTSAPPDPRVSIVTTILQDHKPSKQEKVFFGYRSLQLLLMTSQRSEGEEETVQKVLEAYSGYADDGYADSDIASNLIEDFVTRLKAW
mmetsp:Transcript_18154/g.41338  ORF Transcript_18154/g.41338 Transcript_18154/m.41338 type:complete len:513 (-) Transcript_18154:885-2423(-)